MLENKEVDMIVATTDRSVPLLEEMSGPLFIEMPA